MELRLISGNCQKENLYHTEVNNAFCAELYVGWVKLATCQAISGVIISASYCAAAAISSLSC